MRRRSLVRHPDATGVDEPDPTRRAGRTGRGCGRRRRRRRRRRRARGRRPRRASRGSGSAGRTSASRGRRARAPSPATSSSTVAGHGRRARTRSGPSRSLHHRAASPRSPSCRELHASRSPLPREKADAPVRLQQVEAFGRQRAHHEVAARDDHVGIRKPRIGQHRLERRQVAVHVVQRRDLHARPRYRRSDVHEREPGPGADAVERRAARARERARRRAEVALPDASDRPRRAPAPAARRRRAEKRSDTIVLGRLEELVDDLDVVGAGAEAGEGVDDRAAGGTRPPRSRPEPGRPCAFVL